MGESTQLAHEVVQTAGLELKVTDTAVSEAAQIAETQPEILEPQPEVPVSEKSKSAEPVQEVVEPAIAETAEPGSPIQVPEDAETVKPLPKVAETIVSQSKLTEIIEP